MPTDRRTVLAYDDFATEWAARMRSGRNLAHTYLEKPAMRAQLPPLRGKAVLCLGCGTGEECLDLLERGAKRVVGIDVSREAVRLAAEHCPGAEFHVMDMEKLKFPARSFDLVYSSLTLHYVRRWVPVLLAVRGAMKDSGRFVFSTHHPGWWGAGDYFSERKITDTWFGELTVSFYHKPLGKIFREIAEAGFEVADLVEPRAVAKVRKIDPEFWEASRKAPMFVIFELKKSEGKNLATN